MKIAEITPKTDTELATLLAETRADLAKLVIDTRTKQMPNVKAAHALKKTIARALTIQHQRQQHKEANHG